MKVYNNKLYLNANNGASTGQYGSELWVIETTLSVTNFDRNTAILYPNPTDGELNITSEFEFDAINLYDVNGKSVFSKQLEPIKNTQISLDVPSGFYFILGSKTKSAVLLFKKSSY